ncbi:hypothetical protein [Azospirillum palustre]
MPDAPDAPPASPWSRDGEPVPDERLIIDATVVLAKHAGKLNARKAADSMTREIIARDWVAQLRRSGYRVTFGPGAPEHGTPAGTAAGAMVKR